MGALALTVMTVSLAPSIRPLDENQRREALTRVRRLVCNSLVVSFRCNASGERLERALAENDVEIWGASTAG